MDFGFWSETIVIWEQYGLPKGVNPDDFFGMDRQWDTAPINVFGLCPAFEWELIEDRGETRVFRDEDGVTQEQRKFHGSIPQYLNHLLKDRESWEREFKWRLNGKTPERYGKDWDEFVARAKDPARDYPISIVAGSLFGRLRDLMGLEGIALLTLEDPALFEEMVETAANSVIDTITPALESGVQFDAASMWEDMCCRAGPLISPQTVKDVMVPHYKRITSLLKKHGVDVVYLDCDGEITQLIPLWLEAGVNCMFPIEVGVWHADPVAFRQRWGKGLLLMGGIGKRMLAGPKEGITREVERLAPLVEEGGFIPLPDHRVPPDVPLENYLFYMGEAKRVWGKGLPNIRPTGTPDPTAPKFGQPHSWEYTPG
jgi:uroporphyrinogen decarboxylase